jgi:hypothetical protein
LVRENPAANEISTTFIVLVVRRALTRSILTRTISWLTVWSSSSRKALQFVAREARGDHHVIHAQQGVGVMVNDVA